MTKASDLPDESDTTDALQNVNPPAFHKHSADHEPIRDEHWDPREQGKVGLDKPEHWGHLEDYNAKGKFTGPCGDSIIFLLRVESPDSASDPGVEEFPLARIQAARFLTSGCGAVIAVGNEMARLIKGKTFEEARRVQAAEVLAGVKTLDNAHEHCADIAIGAARAAMDQYESL